MALENATFINGLVESNPTSTDSVSQADDHIRLLKATIKATFPSVTGAITKTQAQLNDGLEKSGGTMTGALVLAGAPAADLQAATKAYVDTQVSTRLPTGIITMWSGAVDAVPTGWALCNGTNGTPDLRDRFVVGAGSSYAVGATGGSKDAIVVAHSHSASTAGAGGHNHYVAAGGAREDLTGSNYVRVSAAGGEGGLVNNNFEYELQGTPNVADVGLTSSVGNHTHGVTVDSTGSSGTNANLPPYYALAYIMKL